MLLRSASAPILSSLVSEGDLECSGFNKSFEASHHRSPLLPLRGLSSKHMPSMRRAARSETDLQGLVHSLTEAEDRFCTGEKKHHHAFPKLSIIQEKEQFSTSISGVGKHYLEKEGFTINRKACSPESGKQTACLPTSSLAQYVRGSPLVKDCERFDPLLMTSGIGVSSKAEDLTMNVDAGVHGCDGIRGGSGGRGGPSSNPHGDSNTTELYYQKLLHSDPQNPLYLRNYAQFLSEAKHDHKKSEEYYERAILACPNDGEVLSKYAKHVWDVHKDAERAGRYFDQAVKATPEDCYVLASYASFLWQSEEDEEDTNKVLQMTLPSLHGTCASRSPLMASA